MQKMTLIQVLALALAAVPCLAAPGGAAAGGADAAGTEAEGRLPADTSRVVDLDEVVVVAQPKESFRLRRQPLGSTVFTGGEMQSLGLRLIPRLSEKGKHIFLIGLYSRLIERIDAKDIGAYAA